MYTTERYYAHAHARTLILYTNNLLYVRLCTSVSACVRVCSKGGEWNIWRAGAGETETIHNGRDARPAPHSLQRRNNGDDDVGGGGAAY